MFSAPTARRLWIGLPAYNEEATIPALFPRFKQVFKDKREPYSIVLYNDGCTDRTVERALEWSQELNIEVIGKPVNMGLGEGLRCLIAHALERGDSNDVLIVMDCDDTHHPRQFVEMVERLEAGFDVVIASRYRGGSHTSGVPPHRKLLSVAAACIFKLVHWIRGVRDYTCGFRAYKVSVLERAREKFGSRLVIERGFACMVELLLKLDRVDARMCEVPLELRYDRKPSASKMDVSGNTVRLLRKLIAWRVSGLE